MLSAKRLVTAWRILLGVWMPKKWDLSLTALTPYITPHIPPPSEFIDKKKTKSGTSTPSQEANLSSQIPVAMSAKRPKRRVPTRKLIRHVLRARLEASRLLATFFAELARSGKQVRASEHLAKLYGVMPSSAEPLRDTPGGVAAPAEPQGWRDAKEVIRYLRARGANIGQLSVPAEADWAAASSDGESFEHASNAETDDDLVWVPPSSS